MSTDLAKLDVVQTAADIARAGGYDFDNCKTRQTGRNCLPDVAAALVVCESSYVDAAQLLGVRYGALQKFVGTSQELMRLLRIEREKALDKVEKSMWRKALSGEIQAERFILQTQGKHRGYGKTMTITTEPSGRLRELLHEIDHGNRLPSDMERIFDDRERSIIDVTPTKPNGANDHAKQD